MGFCLSLCLFCPFPARSLSVSLSKSINFKKIRGKYGVVSAGNTCHGLLGHLRPIHKITVMIVPSHRVIARIKESIVHKIHKALNSKPAKKSLSINNRMKGQPVSGLIVQTQTVKVKCPLPNRATHAHSSHFPVQGGRKQRQY